MPSFTGPQRRLEWWTTGRPSQRQDANFFRLAAEENVAIVAEPIRLSRRNNRRPLHFTIILGTPATRVGVRPVSYSDESWILSNSASYCQTEVCNHGIFGQQQSSTYTAAGLPQANASIPALRLNYGGHVFQDTIQLAGITAKNMSMKLALESTRDVSLFGLDLRASAHNPQNETSFLEELVDRGFISAPAYSVWLGGPDDNDCGDILFGAVDHSKYSGSLGTLWTHNVVGSPWGGRYVALSGLNASSPSGSDELIPNSTVVPVQVVFGKWTNVLPSHLAAQMWQAAGAHYSPDAGATLIPCDKNASAGHFDFQLGGARGPVVRIGMQHLVVPSSMYGEGPAAWIDDSGLCEFNLANSSEPADWRLGDDFLRAAYVLFDPQRSKVAVAPLARAAGAGAERIETLTPPDGAVSGATPVPGQPATLTVPALPAATGPTRLASADGFQRSLARPPDWADDGDDPGADESGELPKEAWVAIAVASCVGLLLILAVCKWLRARRNLTQTRAVVAGLEASSPGAPPSHELQDLHSAHLLHPMHEMGDTKPRPRSELPG